METLEYYKLKDELSTLIKTEIAGSVSNERDLQQKYIGIGLKVAAVGLAAAVLAIGLFGIKSAVDINSTIRKIPELINQRADKEIAKRFSNDNPVVKYEAMILDSSARAIASSITTQLQQRSILSLENRISDLIVRTLNDPNIQTVTKLSVIDALSTSKIRNITPTVDQAIIAVAQKISTENPASEKSLLRCLSYFSARNADQFAAEVEKIFDAHGTLPKLGLATAKYTMNMSDGYGSDLMRKLTQVNDINITYLLHVRSLKNGKTTQLDRELFKKVLATALNESSDDKIALTNIIDHADSINDAREDYSEIVSQFLDTIREYALAKNLAFAIENQDPGDISFGFYTASGDSNSSSIDRTQFDTLMNLVKLQLRDELKRGDGQFDEKIRKEMDFWLPKAVTEWTTESPKVVGFAVRDLQNVRFISENGSEILGNKVGAYAIITTQTVANQINVVLKWNTESGSVQSAPIKAITNFKPRNLELYKYLTPPPP